MKRHAPLILGSVILGAICQLTLMPADLEAQIDDAIFADGFETGGLHYWQPDTLDIDAALSKTAVTLPNGEKNAAEQALLVHYLGTGKTLDLPAPLQQLPFRAYFASCGLDTESPRMFVSLTLDDTSPDANPDHPVIGSVFEAGLNPKTGVLEPTGNQAVLDLCNETHGIVASDDCSQLAVLCKTAFEQPVSSTYPGTFQDLVEKSGSDYFYTSQSNNVDIIDGLGLPPEEAEELYKYNSEMWLLEWSNPGDLSSETTKFVIHKGVGGHPFGAPSLVYSESDNSYAASFATNLFDTGHGGRHYSAALMVIERDGWLLNPDDRGWGWLCADGHVFSSRTFWNPYVTDERNGEYGVLCTSDGNRYEGQHAGSIGIKYESSDLFEGYISYLMAANNSGVSNGGGHIVMPIDEQRSIGILTAAEIEPLHDPDYVAVIEESEQAAINFFGAEQAEAMGLTGLAACNWYFGAPCLFEYMRYELQGTYPLFEWGFWSKNLPNFVPRDLSKIGIFHMENGSSAGRNIPQPDGSLVRWIAEDDDCMLGAPQLVDLKNGRYLLGYGKFQCISDGFHLRRFATNTNGTRSQSTLIPSEYYVMEIDADGKALTHPTLVPGSGWGAMDTMVSLGPGRAAWAYIPSPHLLPDGTFPDPEQANWELVVYESPL